MKNEIKILAALAALLLLTGCQGTQFKETYKPRLTVPFEVELFLRESIPSEHQRDAIRSQVASEFNSLPKEPDNSQWWFDAVRRAAETFDLVLKTNVES